MSLPDGVLPFDAAARPGAADLPDGVLPFESASNPSDAAMAAHDTIPPAPVGAPGAPGETFDRRAILDNPAPAPPASLPVPPVPEEPAPLDRRALGDQPRQPPPASLEEGARHPDVQKLGEILTYLDKHSTMEPGQAMEVARISAASGHPSEYVAEHLDELRGAFPADQTDWVALAREHPDLANFLLADPTRFAMVRDESENLTGLAENVAGRLTFENIAPPGYPKITRPKYVAPSWLSMLGNALKEQELIGRETAARVLQPSAEVDVGQRVMRALAIAHDRGIDARNPDSDWAPIYEAVGVEKTPDGEFRLRADAPPPEPSEWEQKNAARIEELKSETAPRYYGPFAQSTAGRIALAPFRLAPPMLGAMAATAAGGLAGGPGGAVGAGVAWWTYQSYAPLAAQLEQVAGPDGKKLGPDEASRLALAFSLTGSLLMEAGVAPMLSHVGPEIWSKAMAGGAARALANPGLATRVGRALTQLPKDVVAGAAGSAAQEAANATAVELAKAQVDPTYKPDAKEVAGRTAEVFAASLADMLVLGAFAAGRTFLGDRGARLAAADSADHVRALTDRAAESKWLASLPPEEAKKAVEAMKRSGGLAPDEVVDNLYASLPEFQRYWQEQKIDPRDAAAEIGPETLKAYDAAVAEKGAHVAIPAAEYLSKLAVAENGKHARALAPDLTLKPDVNTPRQEAAEHATRIARQKELAALPPDQMDEGQRRVFDEFQRQALEAGEDAKVAESNGAWFSAGLATLAERAGRGETAWDLWQIHPVNIEGPHTAKNRERAHYAQALEDFDAHPAGKAWSFLKSGQAGAGLEALDARLREQAVARGEGAVPKDLAAKIEKAQAKLARMEGGDAAAADLAAKVARGELSEEQAAKQRKWFEENADLATQKSPLRTERLALEPDPETGIPAVRPLKAGEQAATTRPLRTPAWLKTEDFLADRQAWEWTWSATGLDAPEQLQKLVLGYMRKAFEGLAPDEIAIQQGWAVARLAAGKGGRKFETLREKVRDWMRQPEGSRAEDPIPERAWPHLITATRKDTEYVSAGKYVNRKRVEVFQKWLKTTTAEVSEERPTYGERPPAWFAEGDAAPAARNAEKAAAVRKELEDLNRQAREARGAAAKVRPKLDLDETSRILGNDAKLVPTEKGGISPDELARAVGAPSGDALLRDMLERRERATWAKTDAARRVVSGAAPRAPAASPAPEASRVLAERWQRMTPEERAREFFVDRNTGILNERGFAALPPDPARPMVGHISVEGTKWLNDGGEGGHAAGDLIYRMAARALHELVPDAAKVGGDFAIRVKDQAALDGIVSRLNETLPVKGFAVTGVVGEAFQAAHDAHVALKQRLEGEGARAPRGERPRGVLTESPADVVLPRDSASAELPDALREGHRAMTPRQAFEAAYVEPETGLLTAAGWNGIPRKAHVASVDLDGLKALNERLGTEGGDVILRLFGILSADEGGHGFDVAHLHGDEYVAQSNDAAALQGFLDKLGAVSDNVRVEVDGPDGKVYEVQGIGFSHGIGRSDVEAERALKAHKSERERAGQRGVEANARRLRVVDPEAGRPEDLAGRRDDLGAGGEGQQRRAPRQGYAGPEGAPEGVAAQRLEQAQRAVVSTSEFRSWFRDSKVVDPFGDPLVVFHGTATGGFDVFATTPSEGAGRNTKARTAKLGAFFSNHPATANGFAAAAMNEGASAGASQVYPVFLSIRNPLRPDSVGVAEIQGLEREFSGLTDRLHAINNDPARRTSAEQESLRKAATKREVFSGRDYGSEESARRAALQREKDLVAAGMRVKWNIYYGAGIADRGVEITAVPKELVGEGGGRDFFKALQFIARDPKAREKLERLGYDGIIVETEMDAPVYDHPTDAFGDVPRFLGRIKQYVAFRPEQVKSATGNRGTFDPSNPNILEQGPRLIDSIGSQDVRFRIESKNEPMSEARFNDWLDERVGNQDHIWAKLSETEERRFTKADFGAYIKDLLAREAAGDKLNVYESLQLTKYVMETALGSITPEDLMSGGERLDLPYNVLALPGGEVKDPLKALEQKKKGEAGPRGVVEFPDLEPGKAAPFFVRLLDSDRSTLAHESFHAFSLIMGQLAARGDAPAELRADYERLVKVMGYESAADRAAKRVDKREEKGSHLWEMYLAEGQAPSRELLPVFSRFRAWLRRIYQSAKGISDQYEARYGEKLALSDDAREIFGRLLAGDEAVRDASKEFEVEQPKVAFTPEEQAQSDRNWAEARAAGEAELQRQMVEEERKADREFVREARAKIGEEVGPEIDKEPPYAAIAALSKGDVAGMEVRLDRAAVEALVGKDVAARLPKEVFGEKDGVPPDAIAAALHFPSGTDLVLAMANALPRDARVKQEVSRLMAERYPSLQDRPRAMYEAAKGAMAGDAFLRDGIMRLRAIAREAGVHPNITDERALKAATDEIVKGKTWSGLRPERFDAAAKKYARIAAESKDPQKRLDAYESYLWNRALYRSALDGRAEAEKVAAYLVPFTRPKGRAKLGKATEVESETLPDGTVVSKTTQPYLDKVDDLLSAFEFKASATKKEVLSRAALEEWVRQRWADGDSVVVPPSILTALERQTHWKDLTIAELGDLRDAVRSIAEQANLRTKFIVGGERIATDRVIEELKAAAIANGAKVKLHLAEQVRTRREKAAEAGRQAKHALEHPEVLVDELDGYDPQGPWHRYYWNPLSDAAYHYADLVRGSQQKVQQMLRDLPAAERERLRSKITIEGVEYPLEAAVVVGLNVANESNESKITRGMSDPRLAENFGIQPWQGKQTVDAFLAHLTRRDVDLINAMHRALESYWEAAEALEKRDSGIAPVKIPVRPRRFVGANGEMLQIDGGYYPVIYSRKYRVGKTQMENDEAAVNGLPGVFHPGYERALTPQGHLQTRIDTFTRPFDLTLDAFPRKLTMTGKDIAFRLTAKQQYRVLMDERLVGALTQALGDKGHDLLVAHLRDSVNDVMLPDPGAGIFREVIEKLRGLAFRSTFALNVPQTLQNLADPTGIAAVMPPQHFIDAAFKLAKDPAALKAWILERSGEMRLRADGMNRLSHDLKSVFRKSEAGILWDRAGELMLAPFEATQQMTEFPTWLGAHEHATTAKEKGGLGLSEEEAVRHADSAVRRMFGGRRTMDLTPIQRDKVLRHFTMFWGWSAAQLNQFIRASGLSRKQWTEGMALKALATIGKTYAALAAKEVASNLLVGNGPEDKDEDGKVGAGDVARWLAFRALFTLPSRLPGIGSAITSLEGGPVRDVSLTPWTNILSAGTRTLAKTISVASEAADGTAGEDEEIALFMSWLEAGGQFVGGPAGQFRRTAHYLMDRPPDAAPGEDVLGTMFGPSRPGKLSNTLYGR